MTFCCNQTNTKTRIPNFWLCLPIVQFCPTWFFMVPKCASGKFLLIEQLKLQRWLSRWFIPLITMLQYTNYFLNFMEKKVSYQVLSHLIWKNQVVHSILIFHQKFSIENTISNIRSIHCWNMTPNNKELSSDGWVGLPKVRFGSSRVHKFFRVLGLVKKTLVESDFWGFGYTTYH